MHALAMVQIMLLPANRSGKWVSLDYLTMPGNDVVSFLGYIGAMSP
jgi:hypothetical protein